MSTNSCALDTIVFDGLRVGRTRLRGRKVLNQKLFYFLDHRLTVDGFRDWP